MILQRLVELYDRIAADPATADVLPKPGYSLQKCSFCVVLNADGTLNSFQSLLEQDKKKLIPRMLLVPGQAKPSGQGINPCFLWDNSGYLLGYKIDDADPVRSLKSFEAFRKRHLDLQDQVDDPAFAAVCIFLENWTPEDALKYPELAEISGSFGVFKIAGATHFVHDAPKIIAFWAGHDVGENAEDASSEKMCLVTGAVGHVARVHKPAIKGVIGGQPAGTLLVSFNDKAYESRGREQGDNAPVSETTAFKYTNALNYLLARSDRRLTLGDATVVFWAERPTPLEAFAGGLFGDYPPPAEDAPAEDKDRAEQARRFITQLRTGHADTDALAADSKVGFYILGLSPNASRISVRFWIQTDVAEMKRRLAQFIEDVRIGGISEDRPITVRRMVNATARIINDKPDFDTISPRLSGDVTRAALNGTAFPEHLLFATLNRIRSDSQITPPRAAILKAFVIRNGKIKMDPYLDKTHPEPAYHCGRLLAVLAFAQEEALGAVNSGVIRRSLGSVMASPGLQLGRLQRAAEVGHIPKLERDLPEFVRDELKFINSSLKNEVPLRLRPLEQSIFMLGFYQELQFLDFVGQQVASGRRVRTKQGEWVRSNGEKQLAELLTKINVPYIFEPTALLPSGSERWPDFMVRGASKDQTVFIEYLGMNTDNYNKRWEEKVIAYAEAGITESGGPSGKLAIVDAREKRLDDVAMLEALRPFLNLQNTFVTATTEGAAE